MSVLISRLARFFAGLAGSPKRGDRGPGRPD
jgi:hypothetical protein